MPRLDQHEAQEQAEDNIRSGVIEEGLGDEVTVNLDELDREERRGRADEEGEGKDGQENKGGKQARDNEFNDGGDDQRDKLRQKRREERERKREKNTAKDTEITQLREQVAALSQGFQRIQQGSMMADAAAIDTRLTELQGQYNEAERIHTEAVTKANGEAATKASQAMRAAESEYERLAARKQAIANAAAQRQQNNGQQRADPRITKNASEFIADIDDWYDPEGGDRDSAAVKRLDRKLANEGWNPAEKGYWEELRDRVEEELPHRFGRQQRDTTQQRRPRVGGGGGGGGEGQGNTRKVPASYINNLKEAGMWEDTKVRNKMFRKFFENQDKLRGERN